MLYKTGSGAEHRYLHNAHGDVIGTMQGVQVNRYDYDAFGNQVRSPETTRIRFATAANIWMRRPGWCI